MASNLPAASIIIPVSEISEDKKEGFLKEEFAQKLDSGGRFFRNIAVLLVKVDDPFGDRYTYYISFKVMAKKYCAQNYNSGVRFELYRGTTLLESINHGRIAEMQYANIWYDFKISEKIKAETFISCNSFKFIANRDDVVIC